MERNHLTDEQIQTYLTKEIQDDAMVSHLNSCSTCRENLNEYLRIVEGAQQMTAESFTFDVTELVMTKIVQYESRKNTLQNWIFWGILSLLVILTVILCLPYLSNVLAIFSSNSTWTTVFATGTGILLFSVILIDVLRQHKSTQKKLLNQHLQPIRKALV